MMLVGLLVALALGGSDPRAAQCEAGDGKACVALGEALLRASDDDLARGWLEKGCALGVGGGCVRAAELARDDAEGRQYEAERDLFDKGCRLGVAEACRGLGAVLETWDQPIAPKGPLTAEAFAAFARGCELGDAAACTDEGRMLRASHQLKTDPRRARALWEKACKGGVAAACIHLAAAERDGWGGKRDRARALALLDGACRRDGRGDVRAACTWADFERARGDVGVDPDPAALEALRERCPQGRGDALACYLDVRLVQLGRAAPHPGLTSTAILAATCDERAFPRGCAAHLAAMIYDRVSGDALATAAVGLRWWCDRGDVEACVWYGKVLYGGKWREHDPERGAALEREACERGSAEGCTNLAMLQIVGTGVPKDEAAGLRLAERTCDGGHARACLAIATMHERKLVSQPSTEAVTTFRARACRLGLCAE